MEMTSAQAWAHLRHNVALPSEGHRFMAICSILDKWPDQLTRPAATDFAEHAIEAWTYDRRTSNASLETLPMISCPSSFRLARSLDLKVSPAREMGFLRDIPLDRISYLHLRGSSDAVHRLLTTANLPSLRYLELSCRLDEGFFYDPPSLLGILEGISIPRNAHVDAIRALFKEIELAGLKRIEIGGDTIRELRLESWPGSIQSLCVHGADAETLAVMASARNLPHVLHFRDVSISAVPNLYLLPPEVRVESISMRPAGGGTAEPINLRPVFGAAIFSGLRELTAYDVSQAGAINDILGGRVMPKLEELRLINVPMTGQSINALTSAHMPALRRLTVSRSQLDDKQLSSLCGASWMSQVDELDLSMNRLTDEGIRQLVQCKAMRNLRLVNLGGSDLTCIGLDAIVNPSHRSSIEDLYVGGTSLGPEAGGVLANCSLGEKLRTIALDYTNLGDAGFSAILAGQHWPRLRRFFAGGNSISEAALANSASSTAFRSLWSLRLSMNPLGDGGAARLAGSEWASSLVELDMSFTKTTVRGVVAILTGRTAVMLRRLISEFVGETDFSPFLSFANLLAPLQGALVSLRAPMLKRKQR